jgi:hypothetical protein
MWIKIVLPSPIPRLSERSPYTYSGHLLAFCGCHAGRTWESHSCTQSHSALRSFQTHLSSTRIPKSCFHLRLHSPHRHRSFHLDAQTPRWNSNEKQGSLTCLRFDLTIWSWGGVIRIIQRPTQQVLSQAPWWKPVLRAPSMRAVSDFEVRKLLSGDADGPPPTQPLPTC